MPNRASSKSMVSLKTWRLLLRIVCCWSRCDCHWTERLLNAAVTLESASSTFLYICRVIYEGAASLKLGKSLISGSQGELHKTSSCVASIHSSYHLSSSSCHYHCQLARPTSRRPHHHIGSGRRRRCSMTPQTLCCYCPGCVPKIGPIRSLAKQARDQTNLGSRLVAVYANISRYVMHVFSAGS